MNISGHKSFSVETQIKNIIRYPFDCIKLGRFKAAKFSHHSI